MKPLQINSRLVIGLVLGLSFLTSLIWFAAFTPSRIERVLFFPGAIDRELEGEARLVPRRNNLEHDVSTFLDELTYGPARIDRSRVVPRHVRTTSVMVRGGTAYVDLSPRMLDEDGSVNLSIEESLAAIEYNLSWNFRELDRVVLTIGGELLRRQQPGT